MLQNLLVIKSCLLLLTTYIYVSVPSPQSKHGCIKKSLKVGILKSLKPKFIVEKTIKHTLFLGFLMSLINANEAELSQKKAACMEMGKRFFVQS